MSAKLEAVGVRAAREAQRGQAGAQARVAAIDAEIVKARAPIKVTVILPIVWCPGVECSTRLH
jgi:hypothetical protein